MAGTPPAAPSSRDARTTVKLGWEEGMARDAAIEAHRSGKLQKVTYVSSSMVFESTEHWPSKEGDERRIPPPLSSYGFQKLAVEYHYVNHSRDAMVARAKLSFHVVGAEQVKHLVQTARFENFTIYTPPKGQSSHLGECRVREEMVVSDLARRTQRYGTGFKVWLVGGERDGALPGARGTRRHRARAVRARS